MHFILVRSHLSSCPNKLIAYTGIFVVRNLDIATKDE
jgi:hypothetical protein